MDIHIYGRMNASHLSRIDNLVMNLEKMDFQRRYFEGTDVQTLKPFTNFSVSEILKPDFRNDSIVACSSVYDSDSDDTRSIGSVDSYSSDEIHLTHQTSQSHRPMNHLHQTTFVSVPLRKNGDVSGWFHDRSFIKDNNSSFRKNCDISTRFQERSFVRDEDFSSDSSDNEVALDLRIQRKKTPPKVTGSLPAWVYCTRYSDRPTAGPRTRKSRRKPNISDKRNRTAFNAHQVYRLGVEFELNPYLSETRRLRLATELGLSEASVKVWFQNQRAKAKKDRVPNPLAVRLAEDGLYNHKTVS